MEQRGDNKNCRPKHHKQEEKTQKAYYKEMKNASPCQ